MKNTWKMCLLVGVLCVGQAQAQLDWNLGGNLVNLGTDYLGCNATSTFPLHLRTIPNLSIDQSTSNTLRARLYPNQTSNFNLNYPAVAQNGFFALSGTPNFFTNAASPGAFSRLHLVDPAGSATNTAFYAPTAAYRGWMRNGVTMTGNADMGYLGQMYNANDRTDMVLHWSNDAGTMAFAPDRLKVVFTTAQDGAASGATSFNGLEAARFYPPRANEVYMGLGDFFAGNLLDPFNITEPTERLDVLNGRVRIRQLPLDPQAETLTKFLVVDDVDPNDPEYGVVKWRNLPPSATANCEWYRNSLPANRYVLSGTAVANPLSTCPDRGWLYAIGKATAVPGYKLDIEHSEADRVGQLGGINLSYHVNDATTANIFGIRSTLDPAQYYVPNGYGVYATVSGPGTTGTGTLGRVLVNRAGATVATAQGAFGRVDASAGTLTTGHGVYGNVILGPNATVATGAAVYGLSSGSSAVSNNYGVYGKSAFSGGSATNAHGIYAESSATGGTIGTSYGVRAISSGSAGIIAASYGVYASGNNGGTANYGIYAATSGTTALSYGGYFFGNVHIQGLASCTFSMWSSDASLKTEVQALTGARALLAQVHPRNYYFRTEELPHMNLPTGLQRGVIAQELEEVMPELVKEITLAPVLDEDGAELEAARTIKGVNYIGLIPVMIGAAQEQQIQVDAMDATQVEHAEELEVLRSTVQAQQERLDRMEAMLAACCNNPDAGRALDTGSGTGTDALLNDPATDGKLRIVPNPFSEPPTVYYTLDRGGRMQLIANSADGKELNVLQEATLQAGNYQLAWDTSGLAPGMYYVTLLLDGQPMVKKAVKVSR